MNKLIKAQNSYWNSNVAHLSKFVVNLKLIMMFKPKYIII